jgi:ATP-dependent Clp protease ATP-binding subunit ClpX
LICDECVGLCQRILNDQKPESNVERPAAGDRAVEDHDFRQIEAGVLLEGLSIRAESIRKADDELRQAVLALRQKEITWAVVGAALGISRQSAWERFSGEEKSPIETG